MRTVATVLIIFLSACVGTNDETDLAAPEKLVFEPYFEIDLPNDVTIPEDCFERTGLDAPEELESVACVLHPFSKENDGPDPAFGYVQQLERQGWSNFGGAANAFWVSKEVDDNCSIKMYIVAVIAGDEAEVTKWGRADEGDMDWSKIDRAVYLFSPESTGECNKE
ncbi:MAG: hypothetical protein ABNH53_04845 [Henriciella sp.]